jgi:predicted transcriptional regulator
MSMNLEKLEALNLETSAFKVLCFLSFKDSALKPSEIAEKVNENPSTVRARLAELKNAGLVEVTPHGYLSTVNPYDILMKLYRDIHKKLGN